VTHTPPAPRIVSTWEVAAFAAPAAPLLALSLPVIIFLPPYFASHLGVPLWAVSAIFLGARLLDIIIDPALGNVQDRTVSAFGRRRLWLSLACGPLMLMMWVVFLGLPPGVSVLGAGIAVFTMYVMYATMMVAHLGWAGELVPTYHGRTHVLGAVQTASMVGQVLMLVIAGYVVQAGGGDSSDAVHAMGWTLIVLLPITTLAAVALVRETRHPPHPHMGWKETIQTLLNNKACRRVLLPDLLLGVAQGVSGGLFLWYFQFVLGFERESQTLLAIYFIAGLAGVPIWWIAARKIGKHRALQIAMLYTAVTTSFLLVLPPKQFAIAAPLMVIAGIAQGGGVLLTRTLMADVVDEDELQTGARRSGLFFGLLMTTSKLGVAAGPLTYAVLSLVGFDAAAGSGNSPLALGTLSGLFIGGPVLLCVLTALSLRKYPLDEARQAALAAAIAERHAAKEAS
jgi:glycoside/pentoside/hexuronide:cation symporter, GPH family